MKQLASYDISRLAPLQLAWAAGFLDGEGCICITSKKRPSNQCSWFQLNVSVANTHLPSIEAFQALFECGTIYTRKNIPSTGKQVYMWVGANKMAEYVLRAIQPYSITKRDRIDLALEFRALGQKQPYVKVDLSSYERMAAIREEIRQLNGGKKRPTTVVPLDYVDCEV